jgi:hypothetical protein
MVVTSVLHVLAGPLVSYFIDLSIFIVGINDECHRLSGPLVFVHPLCGLSACP